MVRLSCRKRFFRVGSTLLGKLSTRRLICTTSVLCGIRPSSGSLLSMTGRCRRACLPAVNNFQMTHSVTHNRTTPVMCHDDIFHSKHGKSRKNVTIVHSASPGLGDTLALGTASRNLDRKRCSGLAVTCCSGKGRVLASCKTSHFLGVRTGGGKRCAHRGRSFTGRAVTRGALIISRASGFNNSVGISSHCRSSVVCDSFGKSRFRIVMTGRAGTCSKIRVGHALICIAAPFLRFPLVLSILRTGSSGRRRCSCPL